jgi:hypothetical protein
MPAGQAEFDGQPVDVISASLPMDRGPTVVVTEGQGNRVAMLLVDA